MLERFTPHTPEIHTPYLLSSLIVFGTTQNASGQVPVLDPATRITALAAGLLALAGIVKVVVLLSNSPTGSMLMRDYLKTIDVPTGSIKTGGFTDKINGSTDEIKKMIRAHDPGDIGIITAHSSDKDIKSFLEKAGIRSHDLSPDEEIGNKIAKSAQESRQAFTEVLKETFMSLIRYQKMLENVRLSRLTL